MVTTSYKTYLVVLSRSSLLMLPLQLAACQSARKPLQSSDLLGLHHLSASSFFRGQLWVLIFGDFFLFWCTITDLHSVSQFFHTLLRMFQTREVNGWTLLVLKRLFLPPSIYSTALNIKENRGHHHTSVWAQSLEFRDGVRLPESKTKNILVAFLSSSQGTWL